MFMRAMALTALASAMLVSKLPSQDLRRELVLGGPTAVGLLIPLSDVWALRLEGTVAGMVSGVGGPSASGPNSSWNFSVGGSALRFLTADPAVRPYALARIGYQRTMPTGGSVTQNLGISAGAGVSVRVEDRVAVFSELSLSFAHAWAEPSPGTTTYITSWSTANRIGVTLRRRRVN